MAAKAASAFPAWLTVAAVPVATVAAPIVPATATALTGRPTPVI